MNSKSESARAARVFKSLSDERRVRIMELLRDGERSVGALLDALEISQPTLSHHMRILCDVGLVSWRKREKNMFYALDPEGTEEARALLDRTTRSATE